MVSNMTTNDLVEVKTSKASKTSKKFKKKKWMDDYKEYILEEIRHVKIILFCKYL